MSGRNDKLRAEKACEAQFKEQVQQKSSKGAQRESYVLGGVWKLVTRITFGSDYLALAKMYGPKHPPGGATWFAGVIINVPSVWFFNSGF